MCNAKSFNQYLTNLNVTLFGSCRLNMIKHNNNISDDINYIHSLFFEI